MPTELVSRINLDLLYPPFLDRVLALAATCRDLGTNYYAVQGFRSPEEQLALWRLGRDVAGVVVDRSKVVTQLKFGLHNLGLAVDFCRDADPAQPGLQPSWKAEDYALLADQAEAHGLEAGGHWTGWKDRPHVQLPISRKSLTSDVLRRIYQIHDLPAVWALLDTHGPW